MGKNSRRNSKVELSQSYSSRVSQSQISKPQQSQQQEQQSQQQQSQQQSQQSSSLSGGAPTGVRHRYRWSKRGRSRFRGRGGFGQGFRRRKSRRSGRRSVGSRRSRGSNLSASGRSNSPRKGPKTARGRGRFRSRASRRRRRRNRAKKNGGWRKTKEGKKYKYCKVDEFYRPWYPPGSTPPSSSTSSSGWQVDIITNHGIKLYLKSCNSLWLCRCVNFAQCFEKPTSFS